MAADRASPTLQSATESEKEFECRTMSNEKWPVIVLLWRRRHKYWRSESHTASSLPGTSCADVIALLLRFLHGYTNDGSYASINLRYTTGMSKFMADGQATLRSFYTSLVANLLTYGFLFRYTKHYNLSPFKEGAQEGGWNAVEPVRIALRIKNNYYYSFPFSTTIKLGASATPSIQCNPHKILWWLKHFKKPPHPPQSIFWFSTTSHTVQIAINSPEISKQSNKSLLKRVNFADHRHPSTRATSSFLLTNTPSYSSVDLPVTIQ